MKIARILPWLVMCVAYLVVSPGWAADPRTAPLQQQIRIPPQISGLTLNPSTVTGGTTQVLGTVTLLQPASSGGVMVTFRSSNPVVAAVAPSVLVQPGATSATFLITTQPVAANPNVVNPNPPSVQISAQIGNATPVIAQLSVLPSTLVALTLNPASVPGGSGSTGTVTISGPAPSGGLVVTLSSNPTTSPPASPRELTAKIVQSPVSVPSQVTIPAGATMASFPVTTRPVATSTGVPIVAARGTFVTKSATLTVLPSGVASLVVITGVIGGASTTGTVTLSAPAPSGGANVSLSISKDYGKTVATAPASVLISAGATTASFPIQTVPVWGPTYVKVSANYAGTGAQAELGIFQAWLSSFTLSPTSVKGGQSATGTLTLNGAAYTFASNQAGAPQMVTLTSSNQLAAPVPPSVIIPQGSTGTTFTIPTSAVSVVTPVVITAKSNMDPNQFRTFTVTLTLTPN